MLLFLISETLRSQEYPVFSANLIQSKLLFHTAKIHVVHPPSTRSVEIIYAKHTRGKAYWQQRYGFPEPSLSLLITDNGHATLGYTIGIYPSIQFRILNRRNFFWYGRFGGGIGWVTKHWSREDTLNNIIGGHLNNVSMFQSGIRFLLRPRWSVQTGLVFYHTSNASARQPNFGLNHYGYFLGCSFHPNEQPKEYIYRPREPKNTTHFGLKTAIALAEDKMPDGPMYTYYNLSLFMVKRFHNKYQCMAGTDFTYNSRFYMLFKNSTQFPGKENRMALRNTIFAGYEFLFGKIGFPLQLGIYTRRPLGGPLFYQKLGMNWYCIDHPSGIIKRVFLFTNLKTHLVQAELAELGIGINI